MAIKDETFPKVTFGAFFEAEHLVVTVRERAGVTGAGRYYACCDSVMVKEPDGMLLGEMGGGPTREAAVLDYAARLAGRVIVVDDGEPTCRELQCPNEWEG